MSETYDGDSEESRAAFRDYDGRQPVVTRTTWQIWRDACAWQAARATAEQSRDRLLAALERASRAESALRALANECDNEMTLGWEERIRARIDEANILLAEISSQQDAAIESKPGDGL